MKKFAVTILTVLIMATAAHAVETEEAWTDDLLIYSKWRHKAELMWDIIKVGDTEAVVHMVQNENSVKKTTTPQKIYFMGGSIDSGVMRFRFPGDSEIYYAPIIFLDIERSQEGE